MKQKIEFVKIEAAGNDFICLDGRTVSAEILTPEKIIAFCDRRRGIGGDGLIYLDVEQNEKIRMRYFNANGTRGEMCGNGLRAATLLAVKLGLLKAEAQQTIFADDGGHEVLFYNPLQIKVEILRGAEAEEKSSTNIVLPEKTEYRGYINTGVPHIVLEVWDDLTDAFVQEWGSKLRYAQAFQPGGVNVNFVRSISKDMLFVRTFERGVEAETLSCGSGVTASAILFRKKLSVQDERIDIKTRGGQLSVSFDEERIFLHGPARAIFNGTLDRDEFNFNPGGGNEKSKY